MSTIHFEAFGHAVTITIDKLGDDEDTRVKSIGPGREKGGD